MHQEIKLAPTRFNCGKGAIQRVIIGHINIHHEIATNACGKRREALAKALSLIGKAKPCARICHRFGNAPSDRALIGNAHDQATFSL